MTQLQSLPLISCFFTTNFISLLKASVKLLDKQLFYLECHKILVLQRKDNTDNDYEYIWNMVCALCGLT